MFSTKYMHYCPIKWYAMTDDGLKVNRSCSEFKQNERKKINESK